MLLLVHPIERGGPFHGFLVLDRFAQSLVQRDQELFEHGKLQGVGYFVRFRLLQGSPFVRSLAKYRHHPFPPGADEEVDPGEGEARVCSCLNTSCASVFMR